MSTPGQLARIELARRFRLEAQYPDALTFSKALDGRTVSTPALRLLSAELTAALRPGSRARLIVTIPPQEGKTSLSRAAILRELAIHPDQRMVLVSYGLDLARSNSRQIREDLVTHGSWLGIKPKHGHATVTTWGLEGYRGGVKAAAPASALVGHPADAMVIDDPFSGAAEADSADRREAVWKFWTGTAANRLSPGAPVALIMTRWHDDDLAGRLKRYSAQPWRVLNIPAQCTDPSTDPLGRKEGEYLLSAQGRDTADWETRKAEAGPRVWQALFQGNPQSDAGNVLRREWWQRYAALPLTVDAEGRHWLTGFDEVLQSWDLTFKATDASDYVVGQVWARRGTALYLVDQVRARMDYPAQVSAIQTLRAKWPQTGAVLIEDKANGSAVISTLAPLIPGIIAINPTDSKFTRAAAVSPFVAAKNAHVPNPEIPEYAWAADFMEECARFPTAANDDQVDAATQALSWIYQPHLREQYARNAQRTTTADSMYNLG